MLYFDDTKPFLECLSDAQLGQLLRAVINYAESGEWVSESCDPTIKLALGIFKSKIDRDGVAYEKKKLHGQYMAYVRASKEQGKEYLAEQNWIELNYK